jgi:hypothetical protein
MVILPTKAGLHFGNSWNASGEHLLPKRITDQKALEMTMTIDRLDKNFDTCSTHCRCYHEIHRVRQRTSLG